MHEDAPKMSVTQSLAASTSQAKSEIVTDVPPVDYEMNTVELKPSQTIEMDLKLAYVNPSSGKCTMLCCNNTS
ncbi:hypothetical protein HF086_017935 [Spodoptera exigua]|uniref:Uncharacterized protein n=1 Tax=Spodoptera exigua TaxID=7107 RepID=A0A922M168_SPOEX|nr:hypothetical protein HF086_017935 [Spodoptera exigua]